MFQCKQRYEIWGRIFEEKDYLCPDTRLVVSEQKRGKQEKVGRCRRFVKGNLEKADMVCGQVE